MNKVYRPRLRGSSLPSPWPPASWCSPNSMAAGQAGTRPTRHRRGMAPGQQRGGHHRPAAAGRLPRDSVQRRRPHAVGHDGGVDLGNPGIPVPAALRAPPVARPRRRAHSQGTGSAHARGKVYHLQFMRSLDRPIFMDGRPHPPAWAPHTWTGFSTGEWVGNTLKVTTTHLKDGYLKRGGPQTSDMLHDDRVHHPARRHPDHRHRRGRPDLPGRAVRRIDDVHVRHDGERQHGDVQRSSFAENGGTDRHMCRTSCRARTPGSASG